MKRPIAQFQSLPCLKTGDHKEWIVTMKESSFMNNSNHLVVVSVLKMGLKQHVFCIKLKVPSDNANDLVCFPTRGSFKRAVVQESRNQFILYREERLRTYMCLLLCIHNVAAIICHHRWSVLPFFRREWSSARILSWGHRHWRTFPCSQKNQQEHITWTTLLQHVSMASLNINQVTRLFHIFDSCQQFNLSSVNFWRYDLRTFLHTQVMIYAISEINQRTPRLLPNFTIGYDIYDTCGDVSFAIRATLHLLESNQTRGCLVPETFQSDLPEPKAKAVIGERYSEISIAVARVLALSSVAQVCLLCAWYCPNSYSLKKMNLNTFAEFGANERIMTDSVTYDATMIMNIILNLKMK